jgi:DNA repair protein RecN (Recombination protein N)
MLEELHVRDLALIEDVWLEFGPGMTVLSGETGAGKTALIGALKLLVGERADSMLVRSGAPETLVEGRFILDGEEIVARRRVSADGRSRCTLGDAMATVSALAEKLGPLVDLHGQHDHQALLSPSTHVAYLDRHAGDALAVPLASYRSALERYRAAVVQRDELNTRLADSDRRIDYLRFVASEITEANPLPGEDAELDARLPSLRHGERLAAAANEAAALLRSDGGASDVVAGAIAALSRVARLDPALDLLTERLADAQAVVDDLGLAVRRYGEGIEYDPVTLDRIESRLSVLGALKKKYGPGLDDVLETAREACDTLATLDAGEEGLRAAEEAVARAEVKLREAAATLDSARRGAAPAFETALGAAVADLAMESARFEVAFTEIPFESWTVDGAQRVEFLFAAAASEPARPLAKIASGGEVSRVMLALKSVLGEADDTPVLVFDEIDAGIGGATAHAVGRRLAELARVHQVLVVTHLAQVASYADRHLVVTRSLREGRAFTAVCVVEDDERVAEIARMLSGTDSVASTAHARQLLDAARGDGVLP